MPRYHVQRSIEISAPTERVFDVVSDYGSWTTWSPWLCMEPTATVNVTENPASEGSVYSWEGEIVGQGEIEHKELSAGKAIHDEIRFLKPFKSVSNVDFDFEPVGDGTRVTWHMRGSLPWFLFWMKPQMEIFIGMDYERGLKMLKESIETGGVLSRTEIQPVQSIGPFQMLGVRKKCSVKDIGPVMDEALASAESKLSEAGIATSGEKLSVYHDFNMKEQVFDFTAGFMMSESVSTVPSGLSSWSIDEVQALRVDHQGSYQNLGNGWSAANSYARYKKLKQSKVGAFELYKNSPHDTQPGDLLTEIYLPLR